MPTSIRTGAGRSTKKTSRAKTTGSKAAARRSPAKKTAKRSVSRARTSRTAQKQNKFFTFTHKHLISAMFILAIVVSAVVGYLVTMQSQAATAQGPIIGIGGNCLDNRSARAVEGNPVTMYDCNGTVAQKWSVHSDGTLRVQGFCLGVTGSNTNVAATTQIQRCNGSSSQKWETRSNGALVNANSKYCLSVKDSSTANFTTVRQYYCYGSAAQTWKLPKTTSAQDTSNSIVGIGGNCLDNRSARAVEGNPVIMYDCNGTVAQKWSVHSDGTLRVQGFCLGVTGSNKDVAATTQIQRCNGSSAQKWETRSNGALVNANSKYCLSVKDSSTANLATVRQYYCYGSAAQTWKLPSSTTAPSNPTPTNPTPTPTPAPTPAPGTGTTGGSGGSRTNMTFQSYTAAGYTSQYHLYAAGLDWTKPVGAMIYTDGSGEYGLKNPSSSYLLAGSNGLIAVAKKHNMILITPFAPNKACADGDGSCWYMGDSVGYTKWAESLVQNIYSKYPISKNRVAFGGYSSGAQLATQWWIPSGAAQRTMTDGVVVAISYGGKPQVSQTASSSFKSNVHVNWNTGSADSAYTTSSTYGVKGGYNAYTNAGFKTSLDVISGLGHGRSGQFGGVMDAQIREHVPTSGSTAPSPTPTPTPTPTPSPSPSPSPSPAPSTGTTTGGSGGSRTNMTFQSYTAAGYTSRYHLYAAGLDWSRPVGILIYGDGSGEYGLKNPGSSYLMAGTNGLIAVAKKNNMVLLTPFAPNSACADGGGSCWYQGNPAGYVKWAEALVNNVYSKYPISKNRVAFGGYSSGAQLASRFWTPSGAAQRTMTDGVIVSISCGGNPGLSETTYTSSFKSSVHMNWNSGTQDTSCPHTATWSTNGGYNHYTGKGLKTSRDLISGLGHNRSGQFGNIMDAQIREHVPAR